MKKTPAFWNRRQEHQWRLAARKAKSPLRQTAQAEFTARLRERRPPQGAYGNEPSPSEITARMERERTTPRRGLGFPSSSERQRVLDSVTPK